MNSLPVRSTQPDQQACRAAVEDRSAGFAHAPTPGAPTIAFALPNQRTTNTSARARSAERPRTLRQYSPTKPEWHQFRNAAPAKKGKHGVTFDGASTVFGDVLSVSGRDLEHSVVENRLATFGLSSFGRVLVVSHTDRGGVIRIISARAATRKEKRIYEEG